MIRQDEIKERANLKPVIEVKDIRGVTFVFNLILSNIRTIEQDATEKPHSSVGPTDEKDGSLDTDADTKQPVSNVEKWMKLAEHLKRGQHSQFPKIHPHKRTRLTVKNP